LFKISLNYCFLIVVDLRGRANLQQLYSNYLIVYYLVNKKTVLIIDGPKKLAGETGLEPAIDTQSKSSFLWLCAHLDKKSTINCLTSICLRIYGPNVLPTELLSGTNLAGAG
jgi:hypothetical protein